MIIIESPLPNGYCIMMGYTTAEKFFVYVVFLGVVIESRLNIPPDKASKVFKKLRAKYERRSPR